MTSPIIKRYRKEIIKQVEAAKKKLYRRIKTVSADSYFLLRLEAGLRKISSQAKIEIPPPHIVADLAVSGVPRDLFGVAEKLLRSFPGVAEISWVGIYGNVTFRKDAVYVKALADIRELGDRYGKSDVGFGKKVVVEYSSPNISKPIGIGHLRSTIIGEALARIYENVGYSAVRENWLGDWGSQFGKVLWAYRAWADKKAFKENPLGHLKDLYVRFYAEAEKDPKLEEEAAAIFRKLESGDSELLKLWKQFRDLSIAEYKKVYDRLGIVFDVYLGEGFFLAASEGLVQEAIAFGVARKDPDTQAVIVDTLPGLPSFLLKKSDGSTLYLPRDLATLKFRVEIYVPQSVLIAVGQEQTLHFRQLAALAEKLGYLKGIDFHHIDFGLVLAEGKKMSTRKGSLIELEELMTESVEKSAAIIKEKNPELSEKEIKEVSEIVGIGAIIYNDLRQSRQKNISFDWDRMLNFESGSAAYLQYTYARIKSILRKSEIRNPKSETLVFEDDSEWRTARKLMFFPQVILRAQELNAPHFIATYLEELAQLFNTFYGAVSVIKTENLQLKSSRLILIQSVAQTIKNGLRLLNIKVPERM